MRSSSRFDFKYPNRWRKRIFSAFPDDLGPHVLDAARSHGPDDFNPDGLAWLERIQADAGAAAAPHLDLRLAADFPSLFPSIRTYHACRPIDVGTYLKRGIIPRDGRALQEEAFERFRDLGVTREEIAAVHEDRNLGMQDGQIFLALDDSDFAEYCGHYLVAGSEYLQAIAAGLHRTHGPGLAQLLRTAGMPTIFEVDLPTQMVSASELEEFARELLALAFKAHCRDVPVAKSIDFTFTISEAVPAESIIGHYHPVRVADPHDGFRECRSPVTTCAHCI